MEKVRLNSQCIRCLVKKQMENFDNNIAENQKVQYMQEVLKIIAQAGPSEGGPVISGRIFELQKRMFGEKVDYKPIKHRYNQMMLDMEYEISQKIENSEDTLKQALKYAMTGNYIDFGALSNVDNEKLMELLEQAGKNAVSQEEYQALREDLKRGGKLVYLTDNCGEVVLDKLLIKQLKKEYPDLDITVIVRGQEVLNDATMEDAKQIGMTDIVKVIGNGSDIAGTYEEEISQEALDMINQADVIIAKGQGNFETLWGCGRNIYYMFLCKCELFTERFGVNLLEGVLINDKNC
ncbi:damage-control phosphatase ARMT1 family protein [Anaerostipes faecalis]|uniref:damage-control phosphatase ARMT1 family protein n=1 Tax=Anaerostipes faecalis TaxID=2738446 RepID=UPI001C1DD6F9|nr:ARMT1-like domain-containing protein [Anaerostipes faecalis]